MEHLNHLAVPLQIMGLHEGLIKLDERETLAVWAGLEADNTENWEVDGSLDLNFFFTPPKTQSSIFESYNRRKEIKEAAKSVLTW